MVRFESLTDFVGFMEAVMCQKKSDWLKIFRYFNVEYHIFENYNRYVPMNRPVPLICQFSIIKFEKVKLLILF